MSDNLLMDLVLEARKGAPNEVCGFVFGYEVAAGCLRWYTFGDVSNQSRTPTDSFEIDGEVFRAVARMMDGSRMRWGLWHSHPSSKPIPSKEDFALFRQLGDIPCIIVGVEQPVATVYDVEAGVVREAARFVLRTGVINERRHEHATTESVVAGDADGAGDSDFERRG